MSDNVSQFILLCEDDEQRRLVRAYMKRCAIIERIVIEEVASRKTFGGNVGWVLEEFPRQLRACRQRNKHAKTLLVVMIDADNFTVDARRRQLNDRVKQEGQEELDINDPVALLIPRRNVETWISALLGESVNEDDDYKGRGKSIDKKLIRQAAIAAFDWARDHATLGPTCVDSLKIALSEWRKIG